MNLLPVASATPFGSYVFYFLLASFVVALVTATIRLREPAKIMSEAARFFLTMVVCIGGFGVVVAVLEWLFIRPLI